MIIQKMLNITIEVLGDLNGKNNESKRQMS